MGKIKNAVFIMLDTLQFNYLGCYGNTKVKTPNLDRFARNGFLFENAYSEGLPTVPVRRALMTGRFTLPFGGWQPLGHEDTTLADIFWGRQAQTALIYDTPPMRLPKYGYSRGFDYVRFCPGHELDHTTYKKVPLDPGLKAEDFTSPSMVYDADGKLIDDASKAPARRDRLLSAPAPGLALRRGQLRERGGQRIHGLADPQAHQDQTLPALARFLRSARTLGSAFGLGEEALPARSGLEGQSDHPGALDPRGGAHLARGVRAHPRAVRREHRAGGQEGRPTARQPSATRGSGTKPW